MNEILTRIRKAFDSLWMIRPRGDSFEIITPFPAAGDKYVSVFITKQRGKYIVTDGGWLADGVYSIGKDAPDLSKVFDRILNYFIQDFNILKTKTASGRIIFFKADPDERFIPNLVFEVANFISLVSSTALVPLKDEIEKRNTFRQRTSRFILDKVGSERLRSNEPLTESIPTAKFNAIISMPSSKNTLINFITGSNSDYMVGSYCRSNAMFDMLNQPSITPLIQDRIVMMDDQAAGYKIDTLEPYFNMSKAKGQKPLTWSEGKFELERLLN